MKNLEEPLLYIYKKNKSEYHHPTKPSHRLLKNQIMDQITVFQKKLKEDNTDQIAVFKKN